MTEIFILKLIVAVVVVIGLSLIAEHSSPRIAGILSGYPTGSAISLFFFGLEINPEFAANSAVYNMIGLVAMQAFIYFYYKVLFIRALFAASIILLITGIARLVGPTWSGLFSAFPTTLFPLMLIVHFTYDKKHVHTIIKNVPVGIFSLVLYSLAVSIVYPLYGIYWGTVISFGVATVYLIAYQLLSKSGMFPINN